MVQSSPGSRTCDLDPFISKIQAKIGTIKNIRSGSCSETEFLTESRGSRQIFKPEQLRILHAGVDITVKSISNKMLVPEKLGRNNFRPLGGEGIHIDLSTNAAKILENNRLIYNCWYQLYIDSIYQ